MKMPRIHGIMLCLALLLGGCATPVGNGSAALSEQDGAVAVRIKGALLRELEMTATAIDVEFEEGHATLGGFVEQDEQRQTAEDVARKQPKVTAVTNTIQVK